MRRNMACILMMVSLALIGYSLKAYAEDTKPISGSEFIKSYEGKNIKGLIEFLGMSLTAVRRTMPTPHDEQRHDEKKTPYHYVPWL